MPTKKTKTKSQTTSKVKPKIKPLGDRVLLRPIEAGDSKTKSGIIIPDTIDNKEIPEQGEVIAVGEGRYVDGMRIPPAVSVGDIVVFSQYGYDKINVDGEEFLILKEESILAIILGK